MNCGKMLGMKKKKLALLVGVLGVGMFVAGTRFAVAAYEDQRKAKALQEIRAFFEEYGKIATVFIDERGSSKERLIGGVVMEDERVYLFEYEAGVIWYEEEQA